MLVRVAVFLAVLCTAVGGGEVYKRVGAGLTAVPTDILDNVTEVNLEKNSLPSLPGQAFHFSSLSKVRLNHNQLTGIDDSAFCGSVLDDLNLRYNFLTAFPNLTCVGQTLKKLNLGSNNVEQLNRSDFESLVVLEDLSLGSNRISSVYISSLLPLGNTLKVLNLYSNELTHLGETFQNFTELLQFTSDRNNLNLSLSQDEFSGCNILWEFRCSFCELSTIPVFSNASRTMTHLDMRSNNIESLDGLANYTSLKQLRLASNPLNGSIDILNQMSHHLKDLRILILKKIGLEQVSGINELLAELPMLTELDLSDNALSAPLNMSVIRDKLVNLRLADTGLRTFTAEDFGTFPNLETLVLSDNLFQSWADLAGVFTHNQSLKELSLSKVHLAGEADVLWSMTHLDEIELIKSTIGCLNEPPPGRSLTLDVTEATLNCSCLCWTFTPSRVTLITDQTKCSGVDVALLADLKRDDVCDVITTTVAETTTEEPSTDYSSTTSATVSSASHSAVASTPSPLIASTTPDASITSSTAGPPHDIRSSEAIILSTIITSLFTEPSTAQNNRIQNTDNTEMSSQATTSGLWEDFPTSIPDDPGLLEWNVWLPWSQCSQSCDGGTHFRIMICDGDVTQAVCTHELARVNMTSLGYSIGTGPCNTDACPIDGQWGLWSDWSGCRVTCGSGIRIRSRGCSGPYHGGKACPRQSTTDVESCSAKACPTVKVPIVVYEGPTFTESDRYASNTSIGVVSACVVITLGVGLLFLDLTSIKRHLSTCWYNVNPKYRSLAST